MIKTNNQHYVNPFLVSFNSEKYVLSSYLNTLCATRFCFLRMHDRNPLVTYLLLLQACPFVTCTTMFVETYVSAN